MLSGVLPLSVLIKILHTVGFFHLFCVPLNILRKIISSAIIIFIKIKCGFNLSDRSAIVIEFIKN